MSRCPYTWVRNFLGRSAEATGEAQHLRVRVMHRAEERVDVSLPARSARWLVDLIPADVVARIRDEQIPLDEIQAELAGQDRLVPRQIFELDDGERSVMVWLE